MTESAAASRRSRVAPGTSGPAVITTGHSRPRPSSPRTASVDASRSVRSHSRRSPSW
ncbi:hypothetical protein ACFQMM_19055 [Saliphagus sp. GCM10025308]